MITNLLDPTDLRYVVMRVLQKMNALAARFDVLLLFGSGSWPMHTWAARAASENSALAHVSRDRPLSEALQTIPKHQ